MAWVVYITLPRLHKNVQPPLSPPLTYTHTQFLHVRSFTRDSVPSAKTQWQFSQGRSTSKPPVYIKEGYQLSTAYHLLCYLTLYLVSSSQKVGPFPNQFPELRLHLSVSLYYKLLGAIIHDEESKNVDFGQLQACGCQTLSDSQFISLCVSTADHAGVWAATQVPVCPLRGNCPLLVQLTEQVRHIPIDTTSSLMETVPHSIFNNTTHLSQSSISSSVAEITIVWCCLAMESLNCNNTK